ncbi:ABC transporter ATP-binding protein [Paraburkholderia bannensis]|uniref:Lipopolysaccharide transport system ATP-binding protein n=1 Tax=Paraburkholderia tropica TaxID=92647 RepID=A0AAQ1JSJ8_9BURK|nr:MULTISPECIES: ABC transporter ATP-binding protein [Paraburkholderia]QNB10653.1 ABC transporter ATP-binding protein [Paraburkholderia tropica]RQM45590.1 ABC transporter ATP-binding protein [Paraburkholderia bannensis]RQN35324.1 ABC transporter ATP-binding protein [Paraburkholderia tropica]SEJ10907.1 lipopolysaccharide transport system ATP-binding protein [Paraburkholderia tropica]
MSSDDIAIGVHNLGKRYQIYETPRDRLKQFVLPRLYRMAGAQPKQYCSEFWALNDVSFDVKKGETVGIIGRNGSGKSTLLQMICGTLSPTQGHVDVNGRVAALLELGAGFNPEFTGRENIFMNGTLLGLSKQEIEERYDDIVAFADVGMFIDQPVKMYSSGMYVRVAFAIAASMDPAILIVDEALAVGDLAFQAKCMIRLRELMDRGTTVLFVSHDMSSVQNICSKVLWLKQGRSVAYGDPKQVVGEYISEMNLDINRITQAHTEEAEAVVDVGSTSVAESISLEPAMFLDGHTRYGDGRATILNVTLIDQQGRPTELLELHERFTVRIIVKANNTIERPAVGYSLRDFKGNKVVGTMNSNFPNVEMPTFEAGKVYCIDVAGVNSLAQGGYTVAVGVEQIVQQNKVHQYLDVLENARVFQSTFGSRAENIFPAMVWQDVSFEIREIKAGVAV